MRRSRVDAGILGRPDCRQSEAPVFRGAQRPVLPDMIEAKAGSIVNFGFDLVDDWGKAVYGRAYTAAKSGVLGLTRSLGARFRSLQHPGQRPSLRAGS